MNFFTDAGNWFKGAGNTIAKGTVQAADTIKNSVVSAEQQTVHTFANVGSHLQTDMQKFEAGANASEKQFLYQVNKAAIAAGPDFKIAAKDMEWAAGEVWKGIKWCYNTPPCRAAAEKYGAEAVEYALEAALA